MVFHYCTNCCNNEFFNIVLVLVNLALLAKLHDVMLSNLTERLNCLVAVLVRVKMCESGGNLIVALEDLVSLLNKVKR